MTKSISSALLALSILVLALVAAVPVPASDSAEAARLNNLGVAYMNQQLFAKALNAFETSAAKDPTLKIARLNRGVALLNLQKLDEAKAALEKAAKDDPADAHGWYNLGLYYKNSTSPEAALDAFRRVTEIDPNDADAWYFLGSTYAQLKQFSEAIAAFEHALKLDPHHASSQFGLARAYQQSGQSDPAHEAMKKFQYITQKKLGAPISLVYGEQGKYSRAEETPMAVQKVPAQIAVRFVDVTREAGLISKAPGKSPGGWAPFVSFGACFIDYDNDGRIDLFVGDGGPSGSAVLFHNLGNGKFEDVTSKLGLQQGSATGCSVGDYDNDGFPDLAVSLGGGGIHLLHNEKGARFADVTEAARVFSPKNAGSANALWMGVNFVDYDHDGDLDLLGTYLGVLPVIGGESHASAMPAKIWRNNADGTFTDISDDIGLSRDIAVTTLGTDYNNDRAIDIAVAGSEDAPTIFENPREGKFRLQQPWSSPMPASTVGLAALDFNHDGWMDLAFTHDGAPGISLWRNNQGKSFDQVPLPKVDWARAYGIVALDYDNDGWVDLAAVGETKDGRGEVRLFRNLGPDGWKDVTSDVGLDKIQLKEPRAIIAGDYDNDGAVDLFITQNHGPAVLLRNEGGNKNNSLRLALKGLNDNKSAIGTKVEVFSDGIRQKFEVYGSSGYLGQNSPYLTIGLGQAKQADVVRMVWPTGVLQDEVEVAANKVQNIQELDRRGSSCPTLFAWDGTHYALVGDMLGAGVIGHWIASGDSVPQGLKPQFLEARNGTAKAVPFPRPNGLQSSEPNGLQNSETSGSPDAEFGGPVKSWQGDQNSSVVRNIPRPTEVIKIERGSLREKVAHPSRNQRKTGHPQEVSHALLSLRFMEPLEESVYLDQVQLLAIDHPAEVDVYPNEYFASNPPYPEFKVVFSSNKETRPPAGAWDEHGHNVLPDLQAHRYFGDFKVLPFLGFAEPHSLELDLGEAYRGGPLWLLMHGEVEYFSANSMYAADQAHLRPFAPYVEALDARGKWTRVIDDLGFPAGGARTMTADLTGKLPVGTQRIRLTTNLQIYWDNILISRTSQEMHGRGAGAYIAPVPLVHAELGFHGFPLKIEDKPPGNVKYIYEKTSATGPYTRPAGAYTRYGDVLPLLTAVDDKFAVFGSGDEVALDFDPANLPALPPGWARDYFFVANGYEKDMDFYAYRGDSVEPLPFREMKAYPYPAQSFPTDADHLNYLLEYNTRFMSGNEAGGYSFQYP